jgi:O-antigen ligase
MAASSTSPFLRPTDGPSAVPVIAAVVLAVIGGALGISIALGEVQSFFVVISAIACAAVLFDFRVGAVLLLVLLPVAESAIFPRSLMGVTGLNPINLLLVTTLVSFLLRGGRDAVRRFLPPRLLWLYIVPILLAGLLGISRVDDIPSLFEDRGVLNFTDGFGYYRDVVLKPLLIVLAALLVGAALAKAQKPERFIPPIIASVWVMALVSIGYVIATGASLQELSNANSRTFLSGTGLHANDLGRLYAVAYGLLLFTWAGATSRMLRIALMATMGVLVIALLLTFSRGAMLGFVLVNILFMMWRFNAVNLGLLLLAVTLAAFILPGAFYDRMTLGFGSGNADAVSAGRLQGIWLPLAPEVLKSPLWGTGIGSTLWSDAMRHGLMQQVTHPHNAYLEALLDVGVIGLGLFIAYFIGVWKGFRALGSNAFLSPTLRGFYQGAAAGLVAFVVTGFAGSSLAPRPEYAYLWIAIGMMYGQLARTRAEKTPAG